MTLRDLTKRQLYNLRRRCEKERKYYMKSNWIERMPEFEQKSWKIAYAQGLKAGLEINRP